MKVKLIILFVVLFSKTVSVQSQQGYSYDDSIINHEFTNTINDNVWNISEVDDLRLTIDECEPTSKYNHCFQADLDNEFDELDCRPYPKYASFNFKLSDMLFPDSVSHVEITDLDIQHPGHFRLIPEYKWGRKNPDYYKKTVHYPY